MNYWLGYFVILFFGGGALVALLAYLYRARKSNTLLINLTLMALSLFVTLMALEFYFNVFFYQSDSIGTLARQNWRERFYKEGFNSLKYRDIEWTDELVSGKTKVMIVGDSFVEGVGIDYTRDRFSDRLGQKLGSDFVVFNLGKSGTDTGDHIKAIIDYPYPPDVLILSYYINDIIAAATPKNWLKRPQVSGPPPSLAPLVNNSYAANFFYWRIARIIQAKQLQAEWPWLLSIYNDPVDWWVHQQQLLAIYEGTQSEGIPLIVVVFPSLTDIKSTRVGTEKIINWFKERNVPTIDVAELVEGLPVDELVVNSVDAHASPLVNKMIAEELYNMFVEQGLCGKCGF